MNFGRLGALFGRLGAGSKHTTVTPPGGSTPTYYILGF